MAKPKKEGAVARREMLTALKVANDEYISKITEACADLIKARKEILKPKE